MQSQTRHAGVKENFREELTFEQKAETNTDSPACEEGEGGGGEGEEEGSKRAAKGGRNMPEPMDV